MDADQYVADGFCDLSQEIRQCLFSAQQIKFSLASLSIDFLVLAGKSGSLYIYNREPLQFVTLIPSSRKVGSIERITVSPKGNYLVLVNSNAELFLQDISRVNADWSESGNNPPPPAKHIGAANSSVTCFYWAQDEKQLFFGDKNGGVSLVSVGHFLNGNILHASIHPILLLDSEIVQIDGFDLLLLVSTRTGCILCNSDREEFKQIGNRPRDGYFGACFINKSIDEYLRGQVICARPGARFWQVDYGGTVKQTIQFKEALARPPSRPHILQEDDNKESAVGAETSPYKKYTSTTQHLLSFGKLTEMCVDEMHFLVANTKTGVYVFDPQRSRLILWTDFFDRICDVFVVGNSIYCITECPSGGISVGRFQVRHKIQVFESLLEEAVAEETNEAMKRFIVENKSFLKCKTVEIRESLRSKMEQTKELLIRGQDYECLEILSHIGYRADNKSGNGAVDVLTLKGRDSTAGDKTTRTMMIALRNTFSLFSQGRGGGGPAFDLFRPQGSDLPLKASMVPPPQRLDLFREITAGFSSSVDSEAIVDKRRFFTNRKFKKLSDLLKSNDEDETMKETKLLKNLFLIYKSSRMSNVSMVERYAPMLEKYSLQEILGLIRKLELLMRENDYSELEAKQNASVVLFDYLSPAVITVEMDNETLEQLTERYVFVNGTKGSVARSCQRCRFPLEVADECLYYDFGRTLFELLYAREDVENYQKLLKNIPYLLHVFVKYYRDDAAHCDSYLQLLFILRKFSVANRLRDTDWSCLLDLMNELVTNSIIRCFNCHTWNGVAVPNEPLELPEEYSWNYMLSQAARFMTGPSMLKEVMRHANAMKNGEISKQVFLKCLQTA